MRATKKRCESMFLNHKPTRNPMTTIQMQRGQRKECKPVTCWRSCVAGVVLDIFAVSECSSLKKTEHSVFPAKIVSRNFDFTKYCREITRIKGDWHFGFCVLLLEFAFWSKNTRSDARAQARRPGDTTESRFNTTHVCNTQRSCNNHGPTRRCREIDFTPLF